MQIFSVPQISDHCKLEDFFFPVALHDLYFDMQNKVIHDRIYYPKDPHFAPDFRAVVDEEKKEMLSCVSPSYTLIPNEWAYEMGIEIAKIIFNAKDEDIYYWNGGLTEKRRSCRIDIRILKSLRISGIDNNWFAFLRIINSYDKSCSLSYELGFCLETMDEREIPLGLLVPSLSLQFAANHIWKLDTIKKKLLDAVHRKYHRLNIFKEFEMMVSELLNIEVVDDEILPLFCRLAKLKKLNPESVQDRRIAHILIKIEKDSTYWIDKCGTNAYAALCAYADFASIYTRDIPFLEKPSEFQSQLGKFVDELLETKWKQKESFSLDEFIGKQAREAKKQIKLICAK